MKPHRLTLIAVAAVASLGLQAVQPALAANGLAFDSVTKLIMSGDSSGLQPGTFSADFQTASQPAPSHGGMFAKIQNAAEGAMAMMHNGSAEHHYTAGSKVRTDLIAQQTATIIDCVARTITTLDLKAKTYRVESLDHPQSTSSSPTGASHPEPRATDDGSKVAVVLTTKALGPKTIEATSTNGYSSDMKATVTKPGEAPQTSDMQMTSYYSGIAPPVEVCPAAAYESQAAQGRNGASMGSMMSAYTSAMRAMRDSKGNPRFTVSASGPPLPLGKLALWELIGIQGQGSTAGQQFSVLTERGNVHTITDADPVFSVPSDFTKQS